MQHRRMERANLVFFVSLILLLVLGIGGAAQPGALATMPGAQQVQKVADTRGIKIVYEPPGDPRYVKLQRILKESRLFDGLQQL